MKKMGMCIFCEPERFGHRKLKFEDKYWYLVIPQEIGAFGQVLLVVRKLEEDQRHITDVTDTKLLDDPERLKSILEGVHKVSNKLKGKLKDQKGRKIEKIYVLTQCEEADSHLHFQLYPRYEGDSVGNEFLYKCELEEARWQQTPKMPPSERVERGKQILKRHQDMLERKVWALSDQDKSQNLKKMERILNQLFLSDP